METSTLLQQIATYRNPWYMWPLLGLVLSIATWLLLTYRVNAHARSLKQKLAFLWSPWLPRKMLVVDRNVYYEYSIIKGKESYIIQAPDGREYATDYSPDENARIVSAWGARGPEDVDAPFSLAWRWLIASMIIVYFTSMGLLFAWADPRVKAIQVLSLFGYDLPIDVGMRITQERAYNIVFAGILFATAFAWWFSLLNRLSTRQIKKSVYVSVHQGDTTKIVPAIEPDSPISALRILNITISIPDDVLSKLSEIARKMHIDTETLVETFSKARLAEYWQKQSAELLNKIDDYKLAAEAEATLKMQAVTPRLMRSFTKVLILTALGALLIGFLVGWGFGSTWGVSVQPAQPPQQAADQQAPEQGVPLEPGNTTTVTPAPPPPPPISGGG